MENVISFWLHIKAEHNRMYLYTFYILVSAHVDVSIVDINAASNRTATVLQTHQLRSSCKQTWKQ